MRSFAAEAFFVAKLEKAEVQCPEPTRFQWVGPITTAAILSSDCMCPYQTPVKLE